MSQSIIPQPIILYSTHIVISNGPYQGKQGLVTYVGKTGYTLKLFNHSTSLSISFNNYQGLRSLQVAYLTNPDTNQPCKSVAEFKNYYPEYFI